MMQVEYSIHKVRFENNVTGERGILCELTGNRCELQDTYCHKCNVPVIMLLERIAKALEKEEVM